MSANRSSSGAGAPPVRDESRPFTADYIAYHATLHPSDVAIIENDRIITYAQFHRDLGRFMRAVRNLDLEVGSRVAVEWTSFYLHWLLLLAFERQGVVTYSCTGQDMSRHPSRFAAMDLVVGAEDVLPGTASRVQAVTQHWVDDVLGLEPMIDIQDPELGSDAPLRIHYTSGTTGKAKRILRTVRTQEFRYWSHQLKEAYTRDSRFLVMYPFTVQTFYDSATACIRMGGTCVRGAKNVVQAISRYGVTHACLLPIHLAETLDTLPKDFTKPANLTIRAGGASLADNLRARTLRDLATDLIVTYGSNETASISTIGADGTGSVLPGVQVEIVDDSDQPLMGQSGLVRVKSAGCVAGYDDDPDATARMFRNGWFYPGDVGVMVGARSLRLLGRADELLNIGGMKVNPVELEETLRNIAGLKDLCITEIAGVSGNQQVWVAVALDGSTKLQDVVDLAVPKLPSEYGKFAFMEIETIPRTATGKLQRKELTALISEAVKNSASS